MMTVLLGVMLNQDALAFYNSSTGRWLSRDPIEEKGGRNVLSALNNNPVNLIDNLGRAPMGWPVVPPPTNPLSPRSTPSSSSPGDAPAIDCSGYAGLGGKRCRTCYGLSSRKDTYPENAHKVCEGFAKLYTGTSMQAATACVAQCLIAAESRAGERPICSDRNCFRLAAHGACYARCSFFPTEGLPDGGWGVGLLDLAPSCASGGAF